MRINEVGLARDAFLSGLTTGGITADCAANLKELDAYILGLGRSLEESTGKSKYAGGNLAFELDDINGRFAAETAVRTVRVRARARERRHRVLPLPRIPVTALYTPENRAYARGLQPFILTGLANSSGWSRKALNAFATWDASFFVDHFGERRVDYYPHNMETSTVQPMFMSMREALGDLLSDASAGHNSHLPRGALSEGRYLQWNLNSVDWRRVSRFLGPLPPLFTSDERWLDACLPSDALRGEFFLNTHWRMIIIGSKDAGMFNHKDSIRTSSFQVSACVSVSHLLVRDEVDGRSLSLQSGCVQLTVL